MRAVNRFQVVPLVSQPQAARQALRASEGYSLMASKCTGFVQDYYKLMAKWYASLARDYKEGVHEGR